MNSNLNMIFGKCENPDCTTRVCTVFVEDTNWKNHCAHCHCSCQTHGLIGHLHEGVVQFFPPTSYSPRKFTWDLEYMERGTATSQDSMVETETTVEEDENGEFIELTKTKYVTPVEKGIKRYHSSRESSDAQLAKRICPSPDSKP